MDFQHAPKFWPDPRTLYAENTKILISHIYSETSGGTKTRVFRSV